MFGGNHAEDVMCSNPDELLPFDQYSMHIIDDFVATLSTN